MPTGRLLAVSCWLLAINENNKNKLNTTVEERLLLAKKIKLTAPGNHIKPIANSL